MKKLMMTTALIAVTSMGAVAQTAGTGAAGGAATAQQAQQGANVQAFLVSDFTGKNLYTLDPQAAGQMNNQAAGQGQATGTMRWDTGQTFGAARDQWEDVGNIDDVIITQEGEIRGVLIDVGGFLGIGARTVMVDIQDLHFVADTGGMGMDGMGGTTGDAGTAGGGTTAAGGTTADGTMAGGDIDDFSVVASMTREQLEALPEWDDAQLRAGFERRNDMHRTGMQDQDQSTVIIEPNQTEGQQATAQTEGQDGMVTATPGRTEVPEGYRVVEREELTAEMVLGADVYGREGEQIATVDDLVIGQDGELTHAIMDVGGFIGMGTHTVAIEIDDLDILHNQQDDSVRIQVTMTQEELESLPEYEG